MRTLRLNARGEDVTGWQDFLRRAGHYQGDLDGSFGPRTLEATRAFQRANHLRDDGVVGNKTLGLAMQQGLDLTPEDQPLPNGPEDGVASLGDAWTPPGAPTTAERVVVRDPRVLTNHQAGVLPCPKNPCPPVGWAYWQGAVPEKAGKLAVEVQANSAGFPMGTFVQALLDGQLVAARVEWHDYQGATGRHGCFRGTNLLRPKVAP